MEHLPIKLFVFSCLALSLGAPCHAQSYSEITGDCNIIIQGSNNNLQQIKCSSGAPNDAGEVLVVVAKDSFEPVFFSYFDQFGRELPYIFPPTIDFSHSYHTISIRDNEILTRLSSQFSGDAFTIVSGEHPYLMKVDFLLWNSQNVSVSCRGRLDLKTSATLYPRFRVHVNLTNGSLYSGGCWFDADRS